MMRRRGPGAPRVNPAGGTVAILIELDDASTQRISCVEEAE